MKMRNVIICSVFVAVMVGLFLILTGGKRTDVYLGNFSVDENNVMTIKVGVSSSAGYIRTMKQTSGSMNYYFTFYSTFGINSKLGAKNTFKIRLDNNVDEIYFYSGNRGYRKVLEKNQDGVWVKSNKKILDYKLVSSLKEVDYASKEILIKFDGVLYGKSNAIIDYAGGTETIGVIDKLIDKDFVPNLDGETNAEEILNAKVYDKTDGSIVLFYNNEYVLFQKIN